jgi:hypothetical protein
MPASSIPGTAHYRDAVRYFLPAISCLLLAACGGGSGNAVSNDAGNGPANAPGQRGLEFERVTLEKRTTRDPPYLWPKEGMRLSATIPWIIWKTDEFSAGQLIASKDRKLWYDLGQTASVIHYLPADLGKFDSELAFSVEFEEGGERYRSKPREVRFGAGVRFATRRLDCAVARAENQVFTLKTEAGDLKGLSADDFRFALLPEGLIVYGRPFPESETTGRLELVIDGRTVPGKGCAGFWEIRDSRADTWDRVLLVITVKE